MLLRRLNSGYALENASARFESHGIAPYSGEFRIWPDEAASFSSHVYSRIHHNFHQHPLMELSQLLELARELQPLSGCRFLDPTATATSKFDHQSVSHQGIGIDEVFRRIEEPGSWVALYNIENIPRYRELLHDAVRAVQPLVEREQPGIFAATGFIFISAPPSITPFHIDRENNFWLQVRGRKFISLWDRNDQQVLPTEVVEDFIVNRDLRRVRLTDAVRARGCEFDSGPGEGFYFPSTTPHMTRITTDWTSAGNGVSISIGINFYTSITRHYAKVHQINRVLRRLGVTPHPPGRHAWRDLLKAPLGRAVISALKVRPKGYVVPPGGV